MNIFEKILDSILNDMLITIWDSILFWKIFCFVIILLLIILFKFKNTLLLRIKIIDHDKKIFNESDMILNEQEITDFLSKIEYRVINEDKEGFFFLEFLDFFDQVSNQYLNRKIKKSLQLLHQRFDKMHRFIGSHFMDKVGQSSERLFFEPDLKNNFPRDEYDKYFEEMIDLRNETNKAYKDYRAVIKKKLFL